MKAKRPFRASKLSAATISRRERISSKPTSTGFAKPSTPVSPSRPEAQRGRPTRNSQSSAAGVVMVGSNGSEVPANADDVRVKRAMAAWYRFVFIFRIN